MPNTGHRFKLAVLKILVGCVNHEMNYEEIFRHPIFAIFIFRTTIIISIIIIIIIIRNELGLCGPVSASSNSPLKGLPSHLLPFRLHFSFIFVIPMLFILVKCRNKFQV